MRGRALLVALLGGALFGGGLALSTMVRPEVVLQFLRLRHLGLLLVVGAAAGVTFVTYQLAPRLLRRPLLGGTFGVHPSELSARTLVGATIFGVGWGLCGVCPGPALAGLGVGNWPLLWALAGIAAGAYVHGRWLAR